LGQKGKVTGARMVVRGMYARRPGKVGGKRKTNRAKGEFDLSLGANARGFENMGRGEGAVHSSEELINWGGGTSGKKPKFQCRAIDRQEGMRVSHRLGGKS